MLQSELDNLTRWNGKEKPFYEVYYLKLNDAGLKTALWIRYTLTSPVGARPYASLWAVFSDAKRPQMNFTVRKDCSMNEVSFRRQKFRLVLDNAKMDNSSASGELADGKNSVSWDLSWKAAVNSYHHYPWPLYWLAFPSSKVVAPNLNVPVKGGFTVNGLHFKVNTVLHQGHVWGRKMSKRWAWADCGLFIEDKNAVLELIGNQRTGFGTVRAGGKDYRFRVRGRYTPLGWEFSGRTFSAKISGSILARKEDFAVVAYDAPEGGKRFCYNTKLADAHVEILEKNGKGKFSRIVLTSVGTTAFETVWPKEVDLKGS